MNEFLSGFANLWSSFNNAVACRGEPFLYWLGSIIGFMALVTVWSILGGILIVELLKIAGHIF